MIPTSINNDWLLLFLLYLTPNISAVFLKPNDNKNINDMLYTKYIYICIGSYDAGIMCRCGLFEIIERP